jgi:energy-coupling factor transporter ATP-binding protein EcfA2
MEEGSAKDVDPFSGMANGDVKITATDGAHVTVNVKIINFDIDKLRETLVALGITGVLKSTILTALIGMGS